MKLVAATILLILVQTTPPVPRQATDNGAQVHGAVKSNSQSNKKPAHPPMPIVQAASTTPNENANPADANQKKEAAVEIRKLPPVSVSRDAIDYIGLFITVALLIVGAFGVRAAYRTLKAVESQAGIMRGQIAEMRSAGSQTAELIKHAAAQAAALTVAAQSAKESAEAARISAMAAENGSLAAAANARAAQASADALISAERPWLAVTAKPIDGATTLHRFSVKNLGRTPAMVIGASTVRAVCASLTDEPEYPQGMSAANKKRDESGEVMILAPRQAWKFKEVDLSGVKPGWLFDQSVFEDMKAGKQDFFFYGNIQYRDVFAPSILHETHFCYIYRRGEFHLFSSLKYNRYT